MAGHDDCSEKLMEAPAHPGAAGPHGPGGPAGDDVDRRASAAAQGAGQAEALLRASEARYRAVFEQAAVGIGRVDLDGRFLEVNDRLCAIVGYSREELLARSFQAITHPDDLAADLEQVEALLAGRAPHFTMEKRYIAKGGDAVWVCLTVSLVRDAAGAPDHFVSVVEDISARKAAEAALRASEELNRRVLASSPDCIKLLSLDARFEFFSEGGLCAMEVDDFDRQLKGAPWLPFWAPEDRPKVRAAIATALAGGIGRFQAFCPTAKGTPKWWDVSVSPIMGPDGRPERLLSISRDITERQRAEERLRRNAETFAHLVENNPFGIYIVDADFRLAQVSRGSRKVFENVRPLIGRDFAEVLRAIWVEPFASEAIQRFRHTLLTGEPFVATDTVERRKDIDGVEAYDWRIERIVLPDGRFGVVCYFYDLSERLTLEAALRETEERYRLATEAAAIGTWDYDPDSGALRWDAQAKALFGLPAEAPVSFEGAFVAGLHPEDRARVEAAIEAALAPGGPGTYDIEYRTIGIEDGIERWVAAKGHAFFAGGKPVRFIGTVIDITERKRVERQLAEALRAKEALLYEVNHRVKNSLQLVTSLLSLQARAIADADARRALEEAQARVAAIARLHQRLYQGGTHDSLDFVAHGREVAADTLASLDASGRIALEARGEGAAVLPLTKAVPLSLILAELVTNAVKYAFPDGRAGRVELELAAVGGELRMAVADDGVGLPEGFRLESSGGLGLRIAWALAQQVRGRFELLPRGRGAGFAILVPLD